MESSAEAFAKEENDGNSGAACVCKLSVAPAVDKTWGLAMIDLEVVGILKSFIRSFYLEFLDSLFLGHPKERCYFVTSYPILTVMM